MPSIGFMELLLISIVALLVLGPEKLPQAVRTTALWVGRARRSFNRIKSEIEREVNADEIRRQLHNESILADLDEAKEKASRFTQETRDTFSEMENDVRQGLDGQKAGERSGSAEKRASGSDAPESSDSVGEGATAASPDDSDTAGSPSREEEAGSAAEQDQNQDTDENATDEPESEPEPVTDFYNNPPEKVVVQGRRFSARKDDDDKA